MGIGDGGVCSSLPVCYVLSISIKGLPWLGVCRCGLAFAAGGYMSRPSSWEEFHRHEWTHEFFFYENSFVKFFPHDGGQMSAPVCRLLRISMWHANMSSRIKCCRWIFHLLQCLYIVSMCLYQGGGFTIEQISFMKRKNTEAYLLSFITNAWNIMTNKRLRWWMEFIWILLIARNE